MPYYSARLDIPLPPLSAPGSPRMYPNRLLSKNLPLCTCNYPFYSAYNSLNHRVNFGQFKLCTDIEKNPGPSVYVDATKTIHAAYCQGNVTVFGENAGQQCVAMSLCDFNLQLDNKDYFS